MCLYIARVGNLIKVFRVRFGCKIWPARAETVGRTPIFPEPSWPLMTMAVASISLHLFRIATALFEMFY